MKRIITCGLSMAHDLGSPSILHGIYQLLKELYQDDFEMINLQIGEESSSAISDMPFQTRFITGYRGKKFLMALFFGKHCPAENGGISINEAFQLIQNADVVIDLYGICFCDKLGINNCPAVLIPLYTAMSFRFSWVAKKFHVRSVKNTASYGPANSKYHRKAAKFAKKHLFDCMVAREKQSLQAMEQLGLGTGILVAPDTANLMPYSSEKIFVRPTVGISTSHQIVKQWKNPENYVQCMANLCLHIRVCYDVDVLLIPNETSPEYTYNDMDVSEEIMRIVEEKNETVQILDSGNMNSTQIKNNIAACEVVVASRYHSCVAALSAGVPLMVIGWHYKYEELLHWYGQDSWLLSESDCDSQKMIKMFDALWQQRDTRRNEIVERYPFVRAAILESGQQMLNVEKRK